MKRGKGKDLGGFILPRFLYRKLIKAGGGKRALLRRFRKHPPLIVRVEKAVAE